MRSIDMQTWPRRHHFALFSAFDHPHFSMCVNVDTTAFYPFVKRNGYSLTVSMAYVIARASNAIPEFRQRIRGDQVVEHEIVNPSFAILGANDLFSFCAVEYAADFADFSERAATAIELARAHPDLENRPEQDDVLYMTSLPWVTFTSFTHPMHLQPADSVPRFAWGKHFKENAAFRMPVGVQGHHAVMDGIHMGRFYEELQQCLDHPEVVLGEQ